MSAAQALSAARAVGIHLEVDGDDLLLEASAPPPGAILEVLSQHKAEILALLRPGRDGWSAEDWQVFFDERAGIIEFDGGLPRAEAEAQAFDCCVVEWLNRNPERSPAGRCLGCGDGKHAHDPLLPYGVEPYGHVWLHSRCWPAWQEVRRSQAMEALMRMGVGTHDCVEAAPAVIRQTRAKLRGHDQQRNVATFVELPFFARLEILNRRIPTLPQCQIDPLQHDVMDF